MNRYKIFGILMLISLSITLLIPENRRNISKIFTNQKETTIVLPIEIKNVNGGEQLYIDSVFYDKDSCKTITIKFK